MLFTCLLDMPYGYFQWVRFAACIGFIFLAIRANQRNQQAEMIIYSILVLLFQSLDRELWNMVDVIAGAGLLISIFQKTKPLNE